MRHRAAHLALGVVLALGCGDPADPETRLRQRLEEIERAVEARDLGDVKEHISEGFHDDAGRDKRELTRYLAGILLRNQNIHLATRVRELEVGPEGEGHVKMIAALASGPIASASDLAQLRADVYRFEFSFVDEVGEWRLGHARWRPASAADLFP